MRRTGVHFASTATGGIDETRDGGAGGEGGQSRAPPRWTTSAFTDDLCATLQMGGGSFDKELPQMQKILEKILQSPDLPGGNRCRQGLAKTVQAMRRSCEDVFLRWALYKEWSIQFHLSRICEEIHSMINRSVVGDFFIFPVGACAGMGLDERLMVVHRTQSGNFTVSVIAVATADNKYHAWSATADVTKLKMKTDFTVEEVPKKRIDSEAFWACVLMCSERRYLYEIYLPWLTDQCYDEIHLVESTQTGEIDRRDEVRAIVEKAIADRKEAEKARGIEEKKPVRRQGQEEEEVAPDNLIGETGELPQLPDVSVVLDTACSKEEGRELEQERKATAKAAGFASGSISSTNIWKVIVHTVKHILRQCEVEEDAVTAIRLLIKKSLVDGCRDDLESGYYALDGTGQLIVQTAIQNASGALTRNGYLLPQETFQAMTKSIIQANTKLQQLCAVGGGTEEGKNGPSTTFIASDDPAEQATTTNASGDGDEHHKTTGVLSKFDVRVDKMTYPSFPPHGEKSSVGTGITKPPPLINVVDDWDKLRRPERWPMAECLMRIEDTNAMAGAPDDAVRQTPINFIKTLPKVNNIDDALTVLDQSVQICQDFNNDQATRSQGRHCFQILAVLHDLFTNVLPVPLGPSSRAKKPGFCLYDTKIRYGQQLHFMAKLHEAQQMFIWASFTLRAPKEHDAVRIIVSGAMATIGDAIMRLKASDHPSVISMHLNSARKRPGFGIGTGRFVQQTETSVMYNAALATTRAAIQDYHDEILEEVPATNVMWKWENGMQFCKATSTFLRQICLAEGFRVDALPRLFLMAQGGGDSEVVLGKYWTEFRYHRDLYVTFKMTMAPAHDLPACPDNYLVARPMVATWQASFDRFMFEVAFMNLNPIKTKAGGLRFPSYAVPSKFTAPLDPQTEDDILHIKNLPSFNDNLGQRDTELLLSYLTAPYIRIPLVLNFFATEERIGCLNNPQITQLLESVLFEPGRFLTAVNHNTCPQQVPSENPDLIATPFGYLFNELLNSPDGVVEPILKLVATARETDAGTVYNQNVFQIVLFLIRVASRVDSYLTHVISFTDPLGKYHARSKILRGFEQLHNNTDNGNTLKILLGAKAKLQVLIKNEMIPMLDAWSSEIVTSIEDGSQSIEMAVSVASKVHAHQIMLLRNFAPEEYTKDTVSVMVSSMVFLNTRYAVGGGDNEGLIVDERELADIIQCHRRDVIRFLLASPPSVLAYVMDSTVRVATTSGHRKRGQVYKWGLVAGDSCLGRFSRVDISSDTTGGQRKKKGDDENDDAAATAESPDKKKKKANISHKRPALLRDAKLCLGIDEDAFPNSFECVDEGKQDVEVNLHMFSLTFKASHLTPIDPNIIGNQHFSSLFLPLMKHNYGLMSSIQCATVQNSKHRLWVRLVGLDYDVQLWKSADKRIPLPDNGQRFYPDDLSTGVEDWIPRLLEPVRKRFFVRNAWQPPILLMLPEFKLTAQQNVIVVSAVCSEQGRKLAEIVLYRDYEAAHVYNIVNIGRRFYRTLTWASNSYYSPTYLQPATQDRISLWTQYFRHEGGSYNEHQAISLSTGQGSVVIIRHASNPKNLSGSMETYLHRSLLYGIIPQALLESHEFWQDEDDNIRGYPFPTKGYWHYMEDIRYVQEEEIEIPRHLLWIRWKDVNYELMSPLSSTKNTCLEIFRFAEASKAPKASEKANLKSQKFTQHDNVGDMLSEMQVIGEDEDDEEEDAMQRQHTFDLGEPTNQKETSSIEDCNMKLINLLNAPAGTPLFTIAQVFSRLEPISHILCWTTNMTYDTTKPENTDPLTIDLIYLPFLKLSFSAKVDSNGALRIFSLDHAHLFVSNIRTPRITELLQGVPHSLVLADIHGSVSILVPALNTKQPKVSMAPFSTELVADRTDYNFYEMADARYYLFPVHVSFSFLFAPTLASSLYLLAMRFLHREYEDAFRIASTIGTDMDLSSEEARNFGFLEMSSHRPDALATLTKVTLLLIDSPFEQYVWYIPELLALYIARRRYVSLKCRLTPQEEIRLLHIANKMRIRVDAALAKYRQQLQSGNQSADISPVREFARLHYFRDIETSVNISTYLRCLLHNRRAIMAAEDESITKFDGQRVTNLLLMWPPTPTTSRHTYFRNYTPTKVKVPAARRPLKNAEPHGASVTYSEHVNYFYCGRESRKNGQCKCGNCDTFCGPESGCPCRECEQFNKKTGSTMLYLPENLNIEDIRFISFFGVSDWMASLVSAALERSRTEEQRGKKLECFMDPQRTSLVDYFSRFYGIITDAIRVRIGGMDSGKDLIYLMFPLLRDCCDETSGLGHLMHYLLNNPQCWKKLPKLVNSDPNGGGMYGKKDINKVYGAIIQQATLGTRFPKDEPVIPTKCCVGLASIEPRPATRTDPFLPLTDTRLLPTLSNTDSSERKWTRFDVQQLLIEEEDKVDLDEATIKQLRGHLLNGVIPDNLVQLLTRAERHLPPVSQEMPFDLAQHEDSHTTVAQLMISRLQDDMKHFSGKENNDKMPKLTGFIQDLDIRDMVCHRHAELRRHIEELKKLDLQLRHLRKEDNTFADAAFNVALRTVNSVGALDGDLDELTAGEAVVKLRRIGRQEVEMDVLYLISCLACSTSEQDWQQLNPFLTTERCIAIQNLIIMGILRANRVGHINRTSDSVKELIALLQRALSAVEETPLPADAQGRATFMHNLTHQQRNGVEILVASISQKADGVAGLLSTKRCYIDENYTFDPRFIIFEFTWNLILRGRQREMIMQMLGCAHDSRSMVQQMIMGAGKTTVVGPLLALMLANRKNLVIQVVPPALLDFTRSILRGTFSCIIQKQIFCFVCDRNTEIDDEVLHKFIHAKNSRGIVVTTPSSIKSVFLKFMEGLDKIEDIGRKIDEQALLKSNSALLSVLKLWKDDAVLIMDEVDILLHPLRSELNFPIGPKLEIDFAPIRWKLPIHLLDALFYFHTKRSSVISKDSPGATAILNKIRASVINGLQCNALQATPHLTLLNRDYYHTDIRPHVARWVLMFLKAHHCIGLSEEDTLNYILNRPSNLVDPALNAAVMKLEDYHIKTLNLSFEWLNSFLPHCMQKIDRVSFGIMNAADVNRADREHPQMPRSRKLTAIPFVGKDLPSDSSEFAHPDVVIGLTILAFRYEGLRRFDFNSIMSSMHGMVEKEAGRFHLRPTNLMYTRWVEAGGGSIVASFNYANKNEQEDANQSEGTMGAQTDSLSRQDSSAFNRQTSSNLLTSRSKLTGDDEMGMQPSESFAHLAADGEDEDVEEMVREASGISDDGKKKKSKKHDRELLPLKLMKQAHEEEWVKLFKLFRRTPEVIHWYLCEHIFPEYMRHQHIKLSASGQEIGGNILFEKRLGFSGTPSDLLPTELGKCAYEHGTDGQLIRTLTAPNIMSYEVAPSDWTVRSVLDNIANAFPPYHGLIDTGALITGMSNLQVAQYLLKRGLQGIEGVVFLDEYDRKMILVRSTGRVITLAECGIPKLKRFAFYDQVHTTGMDIDHTPNAMAVQTVGKDMVFRDFAQGAYRMRGIGKGQLVHIFIIPEVYDLIETTCASLKHERQDSTISSASHGSGDFSNKKKGFHSRQHKMDIKRVILSNITAWLLVNSIKSEHVQHNQLCIQNISNVYRKEGFVSLREAFETGKFVRPNAVRTATEADKPMLDENTKIALNIYREPQNFAVPADVPQPVMFSETLSKMIEGKGAFITNAEGCAVVEGILTRVKAQDEVDNPVIDVQMVQEQEEEKEAVHEIEKKQEVELEKFVDLSYSRADEAPTPWSLSSLTDMSRAQGQFYSLSSFHLYKRKPIAFPSDLMFSRNFFNPKWTGHRRLKNVIVTMEWIPQVEALKQLALPRIDFHSLDKSEVEAYVTKSVAILDEMMRITAKTPEDKQEMTMLAAKFVLELALGHTITDSEWVATLDRSGLVTGTNSTPVVDVDSLVKLLCSNYLREEQDARYTVAISLCEAETLRRVIHIARQQGMTGIPHASGNVALQLNVVPSNNKPLDATPNMVHAVTEYQRLRNYQCLRFVDGDLNYSDVELNYLLRSIFTNASRPRQEFFLQLLSCRRRARQRWDKAPLALALSLDNPFVLLHQRILGKVLCAGLEHRGLHLADAFMAINSSHSGGISPAELWGAIKWVGIESATAADVLDLLEVADTLHEGTIQYTDFLAMLTGQREIEDNSQEANRKVPEIDIFGAEEITAEKKRRIDARQNDNSNVNKEMESEEARLRQEIERETILEELQVLQTCKNPLLDSASNSMSFTFQNRLPPSLSQYFSSIDNGFGDVEGVPEDTLGVKYWDFQRNSQMLINLRSLQFLTEGNLAKDDSKAIEAVKEEVDEADPFKRLNNLSDPELRSYMLTFEFRVPAVPRTLQNKKNRKGVLDASEDHTGDTYLELARFNTNYYQVSERRKWDVRRVEGDEDEYAENEGDEENDYYYYDEDMDDDNSDYEYLREDERFQSMHALQFVYSAPSVEAKNRMFRFTPYQTYWIKEKVGHRSTSTIGKYTIDWMAICEPVEGFVVVRSDKFTRLKRSINTFLVKPDGNLLVRSTLTFAFDLVDDIKSLHDRSQFPPIREFSAVAIRNKEQAADHAIGTAFDYKLFADRAEQNEEENDDDESYYGSGDDEEEEYDDDDEDEDDDEEGGGGGKKGDMDMDIMDLMEAVQQAKALKVGDIVERHPEHWNEQRDGNADGHGKGRVVGVTDKGKKITVMWQVTQRKAQYEALPNGQHRVIKVGHESGSDRTTARATFNKDVFEEKLTKAPPGCSNCGSACTVAEGNWYQCNVCPQVLCFNCFAEMIHTYHDFTNMSALAEDAKLRSVVLGTCLRNPKWKDAPREDSYCVVVDCSHPTKVSVSVHGEEHMGNLMWNRSDVVICDPESEQYAVSYLGLVVNSSNMPKNPARYPPKSGYLATVMRQFFAPPEINNKYATGATVIYSREGEKAQLVDIRACLPGGRYTVVAKGNFMDEIKAEETELSALPFTVNETVRFCNKNTSLPGRESIPTVCEVTVGSIDPHKKTAKLNLARGFRTVRFEAAWHEVSTLVTGKWYLLAPEAQIMDIDSSAPAAQPAKDKDGKPIANALPAVFGTQDAIVLPRSAQAALDKRFMAGLVNADIHVPRLCKSTDAAVNAASAASGVDVKADEGTYRAHFEQMTLTLAPLSAVDLFNIRDDEDRKKEYEANLAVVRGKLYRDPPLPFMKQTEGISIDDGKWHVYSVLINPKGVAKEDKTVAATKKAPKAATKKRAPKKAREDSVSESPLTDDDTPIDDSDDDEVEEEESSEDADEAGDDAVDDEMLVFCDGRRVEIECEGEGFSENEGDEDEEDEEESDSYGSGSSASDYPENREESEGEHVSTDIGTDAEEDVEEDENAEEDDEEDENAEEDDEDDESSEEEEPARPRKKKFFSLASTKKEEAKDEPPTPQEDTPENNGESSATQEEGEEKEDKEEGEEEEEKHRQIKALKRLNLTPDKILSMDVRNQISVFYFNNAKVEDLVAKFGPEFPHRYLTDLTVHWGDTATPATAKELFEKRDKVFVWDCERCGATGNSRLLDCCAVCGVDWRDDGSADKVGKSEKVRVALPTSREAKDLKGKLNARLKAQYQKQLDELDDFI